LNHLIILEKFMTTFAVTTPAPIPQPSLRRQKGYSIVELSIALAIISIILVTALAGVQRILRTNNVNNDLKSINLLTARLTTMLANNASTSGITNANLIALKVFEDFAFKSGVAVNAFGGEVTIVPNNASVDSTPAGSGLIMYSRDIPPEVCPDYINGISNLSSNITTEETSAGVAPTTMGGAVFGRTAKSAATSLSLSTLVSIEQRTCLHLHDGYTRQTHRHVWQNPHG
jgi:prepilin-type N-terminal cleavage/methylation domain-containing protein